MAAPVQPNLNVKWLESQKGNPLLSIDGFVFTNVGKGKTAGVTYWRCAGFKTSNCGVTAKTVGRNVVTLSGVPNPPDHGHINDSCQIATVNFKVITVRVLCAFKNRMLMLFSYII